MTLWLFNIAMENGPIGLPMKNGDFPWRTVKEPDFCWANVGKYSSTMEYMGYVIPLDAANLGCITNHKW